MVRPGYKKTEVGVIPEHWDVQHLANVADVRGGIAKNSRVTVSDPVSVPYLRVANVQDGFLDLSEVSWIELSRHDLTRYSVLPGDVLMNEGGDLDKLGRGAIWKGEFSPCVHQNHVFVVRCKPQLLPEYLDVWTGTKSARRFFLFAGKQTTNLASISKSSLSELPVALPPLPEQRAIAAALSDVDALLGGLDRLIAKKRDLKQAAMQQLLTGQTRLTGFRGTKRFKEFDYGPIPDDWDVKPFGQVSSMNGRIGWQGLKQEEFTERPDDPFLITGMNFKDGRIRWDEVYHIPSGRYHEAPAIQLQVGDVLMTKDGTIGKLLFVDRIPHPGKASLNSHLLVFRPFEKHYDPKFLFYQLGSPPFARHIDLYKSGSTFFGLTQAATGKYPLVLPSLEEQTAIAAVLSDMDAELSALEARRDKTRDLKQGMMQELVTGKIRLVPAGAAHA
jgi:type I restriction enzyme, S subunit